MWKHTSADISSTKTNNFLPLYGFLACSFAMPRDSSAGVEANTNCQQLSYSLTSLLEFPVKNGLSETISNNETLSFVLIQCVCIYRERLPSVVI